MKKQTKPGDAVIYVLPSLAETIFAERGQFHHQQQILTDTDAQRVLSSRAKLEEDARKPAVVSKVIDAKTMLLEVECFPPRKALGRGPLLRSRRARHMVFSTCDRALTLFRPET